MGYVLKEEKEYIILAGDVGRKGDSDCGRVQVIPKSWVKRVKLIDGS
jgi:hypothetical protein